VSLTITLDELLRFTAAEREKWRVWCNAHPSAIDAPVQPDGRLPTVGTLIDHIFLAERRVLQRLTDSTPSAATGLTGHNAPPLFDYGSSVRRELEQFLRELDTDVADEVRTFDIGGRQWPMTPRKLLFHIVLHEIRHWAQIALAVRIAGYDPPGDHDLIHTNVLR
jgi:uncharacterized damage-inducible protein DinB